MIQFNEHLLVYSVIGHFLLIHMVAPKRAVCFLSPAVSAIVKLPGLMTCRIFFFIRFFAGILAGHISMPCLLPKNLKKSKHFFWDNNLCEGVVLLPLHFFFSGPTAASKMEWFTWHKKKKHWHWQNNGTRHS